MKIVPIFCLFISSISFAQTGTTTIPKEINSPKNEFGFYLVSATDMNWKNSGAWSYGLNSNLDFNFFNGVYYKRYFGNNYAMRFSFDYSKKSIFEDNSTVPDYYYRTQATQNIDWKAGLEKSFGNKKFQFYAFSDLTFNYNTLKGANMFGNQVSSNYDPFSYKTYSFGIDVGAGVRYHLTNNINLFYESNVQLSYGKEYDLINTQFYSRTGDWNLHINPGTFGIGIRF